MILTLLVTLLLSEPSQASGQWPALADVLRHHGVAVPPGMSGEPRITSFAVLDDTRDFAIAYYEVQPDRQLAERLNVRRFDKTRRTWSSATFDAIGSVLAFERHGRLFFLRGHSSPSNGPLLVLSEDLTRRHVMSGWIEFALPDGRVIFHRGMVHFAPAQAGVLAVYDPVTNRDVTFYPAKSDNDLGIEYVPGADLLLVDRSIGDVRAGRTPATIEFVATTQHMRLESDNRGHPAGPRQTRRIVCDVLARVPTCR